MPTPSNTMDTMGPLGPRATYQQAQERMRQSLVQATTNLSVDYKGAAAHLETAREEDAPSEAARQVMIPSRPGRGWLGLMCRGLGPLPDVSEPTRDEFPDVRRYRVLPYLTMLIPLALIFVATTLMPWAMTSPVSETGYVIGGETGSLVARIVIIAGVSGLLAWLLLWVGPAKARRGLFDFALHEELLFRFGSERWTRRQRVQSCVQFGVAHLMNLIVAVVTLGGLTLFV